MTGVILAGGPASRFHGLPKGLQVIRGERIIDRVARALSTATDSLLIISNDPRAAEWIPGVAVATDVLSIRASVVGIHSALARAGGDVIVAAWDMPFISGDLLKAMRDRLTGNMSAVVPWGARGPEPVCAAYAHSALPHLERLIESGILRLSEMVAALPTVIHVPSTDVARYGDPATMFFNVNSQDDLRRAEALV